MSRGQRPTADRPAIAVRFQCLTYLPGNSGRMRDIIGWILLGLAGLLGALNFYLYFLRERLYRRLGWEYRWQSGIGLIGTILLLHGIALLWRVPAAWYLAGVIALLDTAGIPWMLFAVVFNPLIYDPYIRGVDRPAPTSAGKDESSDPREPRS